MKSVFKTLFALVVLTLLLSACAGCVTEETKSTAEKTWIVTDIIGTVTEDTQVSLKDDFNAAVNKDAYANAKIPDGYTSFGVFQEREEEVANQIQTILTGPAINSREGELTQTLYAELTDLEKRNTAGIEPAAKYLRAILDAKTTGELSEAMQDAGVTFLGTEIIADIDNPSVYNVILGPCDLFLEDAPEYQNPGASAEAKKEAYTTVMPKLLARFGYSAEDADKIVTDAFALETQIASAQMSTADATMNLYDGSYCHRYTKDELCASCSSFPVESFIKPYLDAGVQRFAVTEPDFLKKLDELWTEDNLDLLKARAAVIFLKDNMQYLDEECLALFEDFKSIQNGVPYVYSLQTDAVGTVNNILGMAAAKLYCEKYISQEQKDTLLSLTKDEISALSKRIQNTPWLSDATKAKAVEKMDSMTLRILSPDDWSLYDYFGLNLQHENLLEDVMACRTYNEQTNAKRAAAPVDKNYWSVTPQTINAFYDPGDNSVTLCAGLMAGGAQYPENASFEEILAGAGATVGHELTHAIDSNGSLYNKDGKLENWWTEEDRAEFDKRCLAVGEYFASFESMPGLYANAELVSGEAAADLGGIAVCLDIAKTTENFDYAMFFRHIAKTWVDAMPKNNVEKQIPTNPHPLSYLRVNAVVQQFDEFYDTFDIHAGDGMYLAPEKRVGVW